MLIPEDNDQQHHKEGSPNQKTICNGLVQIIIEIGKPFTNTIPELLALDTRDVIDNDVVNTVHTAEDIGKEQNSGSNKSVVTHLQSRGKYMDSVTGYKFKFIKHVQVQHVLRNVLRYYPSTLQMYLGTLTKYQVQLYNIMHKTICP